jgi:hypothetical protein
VLLDTPTAGLVTEVREDEVCIFAIWKYFKTAVPVGERGPHSGVSEADNVREATTGQDTEQARVLLDTPAPSVITEVREDKVCIFAMPTLAPTLAFVDSLRPRKVMNSS